MTPLLTATHDANHASCRRVLPVDSLNVLPSRPKPAQRVRQRSTRSSGDPKRRLRGQPLLRSKSHSKWPTPRRSVMSFCLREGKLGSSCHDREDVKNGEDLPGHRERSATCEATRMSAYSTWRLGFRPSTRAGQWPFKRATGLQTSRQVIYPCNSASEGCVDHASNTCFGRQALVRYG